MYKTEFDLLFILFEDVAMVSHSCLSQGSNKP